MEADNLIKEWQAAAKHLGLEIITPFTLYLPSGATIKVDILLKNFGHVNGMIIVADYDKLAENVGEIFSEGYGYTVMIESQKEEPYVREEYLNILSDWGWTGAKSDKPDWLD